MRNEPPLQVDVPGSDRDNPGWAKVGAIAAIGFVVGVGWPRVFGVRLGPNAPGETTSASSASATARATRGAEDLPPASVTTVASSVPSPMPNAVAVPAPSSSPTALAPPQTSVQRGAVIACKTREGESKKGKECGGLPGLDNVVPILLRKLTSCAAAEGQTGKLSFVTTASFPSGGLSWDIGKSSTVGHLEGLSTCLKAYFAGVSASNVAHEHSRYTVAYAVTFAPGVATLPSVTLPKGDRREAADVTDKGAKEAKSDKPEVSAPPSPATSSGEASIGWEVALVRDVAKTGAVVARLPRGTKVRVGAMKDGWYAVKYGDGFTSEGFLPRSTVGR